MGGRVRTVTPSHQQSAVNKILSTMKEIDKGETETNSESIEAAKELSRTCGPLVKGDQNLAEQSKDDELESEIIEKLDNTGLEEVLDFMSAGDTVDVPRYVLGEDSEPEDVHEPFKAPPLAPRRSKRTADKPVRIDMNDYEEEEEEESEEKRRSRWLITMCCCCGNTFRFLSNQPQPLTCENPECIKKLEERKKRKSAAKVMI